MKYFCKRVILMCKLGNLLLMTQFENELDNLFVNLEK